MRQRDDQEFAHFLMRLRTASCTEDDIHLLLSRVVKISDENYPSGARHVFKTNREVDAHNAQHLTNLEDRIYAIQAQDRRIDLHTGMFVDIVEEQKVRNILKWLM